MTTKFGLVRNRSLTNARPDCEGDDTDLVGEKIGPVPVDSAAWSPGVHRRRRCPAGRHQPPSARKSAENGPEGDVEGSISLNARSSDPVSNLTTAYV
jgi:hypothetical protein